MLLISGCTIPDRTADHPSYPANDDGFSMDAAIPENELSVTLTQLSAHRFLVTAVSSDAPFLLDTSFALCTADGTCIPPDRQAPESDGVFTLTPRRQTEFGLTLSNQYSALAAGDYILVKPTYQRGAEGSLEKTGRYLACMLRLDQDMQMLQYQANPYEVGPVLKQTAEAPSLEAAVSGITGEGCTVSFHNSSDRQLYLENDFALYMAHEAEWLCVPYALPVGSVGFGLTYTAIGAGQSWTREYEWAAVYGTLPPGHYALVMRCAETEQYDLGSPIVIDFVMER